MGKMGKMEAADGETIASRTCLPEGGSARGTLRSRFSRSFFSPYPVSSLDGEAGHSIGGGSFAL